MCFKSLSEAAQEALRSTFPEMFSYLNYKLSMENRIFEETENINEKEHMKVSSDYSPTVEGSGDDWINNKKVVEVSIIEGSGQF